MKIYNKIAGELLAIAYLPKEERKRALNDLSIIVGDYSESEMPKEQQILVLSIIENLIQEIGDVSENNIQVKPKSKISKKSVNEIEVVEPEIIQKKPEISETYVKPESEKSKIQTEIIEPKKEEKVEISIEDIDDEF